ncbi:hypothetical protein JVT61DRAFT_11380 [Boletus reticuloceps]|uniref:Ndc10 domain-containing protein n=1 Tax=Boletus reticuloceps TaxID=495285 RepID=A0A8I3A3P3_9AGAM|nr:hypothetical protein JVT61DRAFT_11380 [Boletus reticuloceps]
MAPTHRAPSPLPPLDLLLCAVKRARTRHNPSIPARSPDPASTSSKTIGLRATEDLLGQHNRHSTNSGVSSRQPPSVPDLPHPLLAAVTSPHMQRSLTLLEQETHDWAWFEQEQLRIAASDLSRVALPVFPVTAAKVAAFLHHETTRKKLKHRSKSEMIEGSSLGKSHIAQVINALENYRLNHKHEHPRDHETRSSLQKDVHICMFESASKHNEPSRIERSQAIKAAGTTSDTHSNKELRQCSLWALTEFTGQQHIFIDHHEHITVMHKNNVDITKKTHAGHHYTALTAHAHGTSTSGTKVLGGWNESGSFNSVYDRAFPLDALLGAAMYNARCPKEYALLCSCLVPPRDLLNQVFPFVESAQAGLQEHIHDSSLVIDITLKQFLSILTWFHTVLLQDSAILYSQHPELPVFQFHPFNTSQFRTFANQSVQQVASAEEASQLAFQNLPQHLIVSLQGIITNLSLEQQAQ